MCVFFPSKGNVKVFLKILIRGSRICLQGEECTLLLVFLLLSPSLERQLSEKTTQQSSEAALSKPNWEGNLQKTFSNTLSSTPLATWRP